MSVVLLILKIIGILLLALLGLILLLILAVLLVPVRYRIRGSSEQEITVSASFHWLFPLVSFLTAYEGKQLIWKLRILGIPISLEKKGKKAKRPKRSRRKKAKKQKRTERAAEETKPEDSKQPKQPESLKQPQAEQEDKKPEEGASPAEKSSDEDVSGIRKILNKIKNIFQKVKSLPRMIQEKVAKLKEMEQQIWQEIRDESNQSALRLFLRELKSLLGHYRPRKLKADVTFAMADPATTGQVLGVLSLFPILLRPGVLIVPDFMAEKMYFTGSFEMKGHVRTVHVIASAIRLWREQDMKKLIQRVRNRR